MEITAVHSGALKITAPRSTAPDSGTLGTLKIPAWEIAAGESRVSKAARAHTDADTAHRSCSSSLMIDFRMSGVTDGCALTMLRRSIASMY